jgi:hypothetical protein
MESSEPFSIFDSQFSILRQKEKGFFRRLRMEN